jgi:hypothetical protein
LLDVDMGLFPMAKAAIVFIALSIRVVCVGALSYGLRRRLRR